MTHKTALKASAHSLSCLSHFFAPCCLRFSIIDVIAVAAIASWHGMRLNKHYDCKNGSSPLQRQANSTEGGTICRQSAVKWPDRRLEFSSHFSTDVWIDQQTSSALESAFRGNHHVLKLPAPRTILKPNEPRMRANPTLRVAKTHRSSDALSFRTPCPGSSFTGLEQRSNQTP